MKKLLSMPTIAVLLLAACTTGEAPTIAPPNITMTTMITPAPANTTTPPAVDTCPTDAEQFYFGQLEEQTTNLAVGSAEIARLFLKAGNDPLLFFDDDWILDTTIALAVLDATAGAIFELVAPASASSVNELARQVARLVTEAVDYYTTGIDNIDSAEIETGDGLILRATEDLDEIPQAMIGFCAGR